MIDSEMVVSESTPEKASETPSDTLQSAENQGDVFVFTMPTDDQMKMPEEVEYEAQHPEAAKGTQ